MTTFPITKSEAIVARDSAHLGIALYGTNRGPFPLREFLGLEQLVDVTLADEWRFNMLGFHPWDTRNDPRAWKGVHRMKRGKSWDKTFVPLGGTMASRASFSNVLSSKTLAFEFAFLGCASGYSDASPIFSLDFGGVWEFGGLKLLSTDCRALFLDLLKHSTSLSEIKYGSLQLYPRTCMRALQIPRKNGFVIPECAELPLVGIVDNDRAHGRLSSLPPSAWDNEPFNLYWGNLVRKDMADRIELLPFLLEETGLSRLDLTEGIPPCAGAGELLGDYVYFCLSDRVEDSLSPDEAYTQRYRKIHEYLLGRNAVYPGV